MKGNRTTKIIAQMAGLLAGVNGGIINAIKKLEKLDSCMKLHIQLPGVSASSIRAEVKDNHLTVLYFIESKTEQMKMKIANIVHNQALPYFVDVKRLTASYNEGRLDITMPFNEMAEGYNKDLDIAT